MAEKPSSSKRPYFVPARSISSIQSSSTKSSSTKSSLKNFFKDKTPYTKKETTSSSSSSSRLPAVNNEQLPALSSPDNDDSSLGCEGKRHFIGGSSVYFPESKKPFPAQLAVMSKILLALKKKQHALLESPTGSGKTLALLCSALSWQQEEAVRVRQEVELERSVRAEEKALGKVKAEKKEKVMIKQDEMEKNEIEKKVIFLDSDDEFEDKVQDKKDVKMEKKEKIEEKMDIEMETMDVEMAVDEVDETSKKRKLPPSMDNYIKNPKTNSIDFSKISKETRDEIHDNLDITTEGEEDLKDINQVIADRLPKIYFSSRTHSQLAQVIDEYRSCPSRFVTFAKELGLSMSLLGSRKQMCIRSDVKNAPNPNDKCRDLTDRNMCDYRNKSAGLKVGIKSIWDVEDVVNAGNEHAGCPYYYSRESMENANIIFCPYNYLIDPSIRAAMKLNLNESIIILDEAHNVEDVCRDSASIDLLESNLIDSLKLLRSFTEYTSESAYTRIRDLLQGMVTFMEYGKTQLRKSNYEEESALWSGKPLLGHLSHYMKLTPTSFENLSTYISEMRQAENEKKVALKKSPKAKVKLLPESTLNTVDSLIIVLNYMMRNDLQFFNDYRVLLIKSKTRSPGYRVPVWTIKLCFWCMNPAVAFSDIEKASRSIILTSGTLSPMDSFSGELGVTFPVRLEANHVIDTTKQLWIGAVSKGPNPETDLCATYKNQQSLAYQDSLGMAILSFLKVIPGGILVFFPSYALLERLQLRWESTGLWDSFEQHKDTYVEPREGGTSLDELMEDYLKSIDSGGALMFAVFRGKVSEGIDFPDDQARAVLLVGIPYPNLKDLKVNLKKEYQNLQPKSRNLLDGNTWYGHSAFRALNQALGRCIRHRNDYGAIVLLDPRFARMPNVLQLSKWARKSVQAIEYSDSAIPSLSSFFKRLSTDPSMNPAKVEPVVKNNIPFMPPRKVKVVEIYEEKEEGSKDTENISP